MVHLYLTYKNHWFIINASQRSRVTVMNSIKDFLASIGILTLLVLGMTAATAGVQQINKAFDRSQAGHDAMIAEHKASLPSDDGNYVTDPMNGFDDEVEDVYEASTEAKTASYANGFIAKAYGRE